MFLGECRTIRWNKVFFTLLSRVLLNSFILYQHNTKKLVKGLTSDFKAGRIKPGRKSVQNPPDRLLYREKDLKQTKLPIGKRKKSL